MKIEEVSQFLSYEPETGVFRWRRVSSKKINVGDIAGWKTALGYRAVVVCGKQVYCHRLAWLFTHGEMPKNQIDHINGIRDDNRPCNLRDVSHKENHQNVCQPGSNRLAGARWDKTRGLWASSINVDGQHIHLGRFPTAEEAHQAYVSAKIKFHPFASIERFTREKTRTRAAHRERHSPGSTGME